MLVHSITQAPGALNLNDIVTHLGIRDKVRFSDQYGIITGRIQPQNLAALYGAADVLTATSHAEGFGLPIIEAQACGTPVITTNFSSMPELTGAGWTVEGEPRDTIHSVAHDVGADLIVLGTHGRRGLSRAILGSVAEWVVRTSTCPVLTVHAAPHAPHARNG